MSVTSATQVTLTATTAEPPKKTAPAQPWQATGLTYYHNEYVKRAADLGCCGVTQLLIVDGNSLPNRVGKMALFAIVSFGFAMVDVLRAAWTKISGSRTVTPVAPVTGGKPTTATALASASTSTPEVPSKPVATAKPQTTETADEANAEATLEGDSAQPEAKPPIYDRKAIGGLINQVAQQTGILANAIGQARYFMNQRPSTTALTDAIMGVRREANTAAKQFAENSSSHQEQLKKTSRDIRSIERNFESIQGQTEQFEAIVRSVAPQLLPDDATKAPPAQPQNERMKLSRSASAAPFLTPPTPTQQLSLKKLDIFREPSPTSSLQPTKEEIVKLRERAQHLSAQISALAPKAYISVDQLEQYLNGEVEKTWELEVARLEKGLNAIRGNVFDIQSNLLYELRMIDQIKSPVKDADISDETWLAKQEQAIGARIDSAIQKRKQEIANLCSQRHRLLPLWVNTPDAGLTPLDYIRNLNKLHGNLVVSN